jgi:hypothetical protein
VNCPSRLARSAESLLSLQRANVAFEVIDCRAVNNNGMLLGIMSLVAEYEAEQVSIGPVTLSPQRRQEGPSLALTVASWQKSIGKKRLARARELAPTLAPMAA